MDSFGERLKELRKEKGMNQNMLADKLELAPSSIGGYERDLRQPNFETLIRVADFFNVSIDYLLGRTKDKRPVELALKENSRDIKEFLYNNNVMFKGIELTTDDKRRIVDMMTGYFWRD